jgi:hypothetical protein
MASQCYGGQLAPVHREGSGGPNNIPLPVGGIQGLHDGSYMGRVVVEVVEGCDSELLRQRDGGERRCTFPHKVDQHESLESFLPAQRQSTRCVSTWSFLRKRGQAIRSNSSSPHSDVAITTQKSMLRDGDVRGRFFFLSSPNRSGAGAVGRKVDVVVVAAAAGLSLVDAVADVVLRETTAVEGSIASIRTQ